MRKSRRSLLLCSAFLLVLLPASSSNVWAWDPSINNDTAVYNSTVEITYATYDDLDLDGYQDDLLSNFSLFPLIGKSNYMLGCIDLYMELPSGKIYYVCLDLDREITGETPVSLQWINCATEEGWYTFEVVVDTWVFGEFGSFHYVYEFDSIVFDPPDKGAPGSHPFAIVEWG